MPILTKEDCLHCTEIRNYAQMLIKFGSSNFFQKMHIIINFSRKADEASKQDQVAKVLT